MNTYAISDFSPYLFWDIDKSILDFRSGEVHIIEKVALYGQVGDWKIAKDVYGLERLKQVIMNMRYLDKKSLNFFAHIFKEDKSSFRCYTLMQSNKVHYPY